MEQISYKNCLITITGNDMYYKATVDLGLRKVYVVHYDFKTYEDVKKDIKKRLRSILRYN